MKHQVRDESGATVVSFEGDVDLESSPRAREVLLACVESRRPLLVDLSSVSYIDSSGIASLVETLHSARQAGSALALVAVSAPARRVLELARLETVFTMYETLEEGLAGIA